MYVYLNICINICTMNTCMYTYPCLVLLYFSQYYKIFAYYQREQCGECGWVSTTTGYAGRLHRGVLTGQEKGLAASLSQLKSPYSTLQLLIEPPNLTQHQPPSSLYSSITCYKSAKLRNVWTHSDLKLKVCHD